MNTPTEANRAHLNALFEDLPTSIQYVTYGEEVAPTTGRVHLQGYVEFTSLKTMNQVKTCFAENSMYLEMSQGSGIQNKTYCQKDGNFHEAGELKVSSGKRTDLIRVQEMIEDGASDREISKKYFSTWTRCRMAIVEYRKLHQKRAFTPRHTLLEFRPDWQAIEFQKSTIVWGPSGIGKTSFLKARFPEALFVTHIDGLRDFNAEQYSAIIFDDMDFKHLPRTSQIHILDIDDDRDIHCRYSTALIPANTVKVFSTNEYGGLIFDLSDGAIRRRAQVIGLTNRDDPPIIGAGAGQDQEVREWGQGRR